MEAKAMQGSPSAIILDTIKGYGCDFAEGIVGNHHMTFTQEQIGKAIDNAAKRLEEARAAAAPKGERYNVYNA
jgi:transketolase